jgi:hypothetical protein
MSTETRLGALEKEIKSLKKQVKDKDTQITRLEDIDAIKKLQCAYGYYLEHWMGPEIMDCFAMDNPDVSATLVEGTYNGPEGVRRYFGKTREMPPDFLHMVMQVSPVITLDKDGKHARGRWYGYGSIFSRTSEPLDPSMMAVIYEMDYVKEKGIWKILKLRLLMHYAYNRGVIKQGPIDAEAASAMLSPDEWAPYNTQYPSGYIYPFSFVHPVTGKPSTEDKRNAKLKLKPSPFLPKDYKKKK